VSWQDFLSEKVESKRNIPHSCFMPPSVATILVRTVVSLIEAVPFAGRILLLRICGLMVGLLLGCCNANAEAIQPLLPADVAINKEAGRGGWVIISLRMESGEELRMIVDTGAPGTLLDKSLEPKLGNRLDTGTIRSFRGEQEGDLYAAPTFYLGDVPLMGNSNLLTADFKKLLPPLDPPVLGILGMDCLRHYCLQMDFEAGKMRFLDSHHFNADGLGKGFPLKFATDAEHHGIPLIQHAGLLGGTATNTVIDTGHNGDGAVEGRAIRRHAAGSYSGGLVKRFKHFLAVHGLVNRDVGLPGCVWDGNTYTNIVVGRRSGDLPNWIGIRFLARHLVTFDFPNQMMYLKQTSTGPLGAAD
jgi:hypothetical protein